MADEIAEKAGIFTDSDYRIKAGLLYILLQASANGHTYLPQKELFSQAADLLKVEPSAMEKTSYGYADRPESSGKNSYGQ